MKKQKALMVKDFFSADGALHRGETVIIEHVNDDGYTRIFTDDRCEFKNVGKAHFFSKEHLLDILCDFEIIHLNHKVNFKSN